MAEIKEHQFSKPIQKTKLESLRDFIWNSETGEVLGRTLGSWVKIVIFYIIYYSLLAAFWTGMLMVFYQTVDDTKPTWKLTSSLIGNSPGMGFRPRPPKENAATSLIWITHNKKESWKYWVKSLDEFLEAYQEKHQDEHLSSTCSFDQGPGKGKSCRYPINLIPVNCTSAQSYGYETGHPCILIKLNKIYDWVPKPFDNDSLPEDMPEDLKQNYDPRFVYISCAGENPADRENLGPISYYPTQGIPNYYFPFTNLPSYQSPFVFIHLEMPVKGVLINVECKGWAANMIYNRKDRLGSVHFEILVD
ncbi:sodium/potassium-transporting ATPase subunit beta-like [Tachypleus tridentatus]|uniref:sodium/potassium-transporting ATPase subunit beta-like n=1 Tax=Tachypleus tridentatus TaxID=6853 RepID=UPI003FD0E8CE